MLAAIFKAARGVEVPTPFSRMSYREAMDTFGSDKPDRRFGLPLVELSDLFRESSFKVFRGALERGGVIKAINAKGFAGITAGQMNDLEATREKIRRQRSRLNQGRKRRMEIGDREILLRD